MHRSFCLSPLAFIREPILRRFEVIEQDVSIMQGGHGDQALERLLAERVDLCGIGSTKYISPSTIVSVRRLIGRESIMA